VTPSLSTNDYTRPHLPPHTQRKATLPLFCRDHADAALCPHADFLGGCGAVGVGVAEGPEGSRPVTPGEDAICKRTRSTHPMTDISLDELEAILNPLPGKSPPAECVCITQRRELALRVTMHAYRSNCSVARRAESPAHAQSPERFSSQRETFDGVSKPPPSKIRLRGPPSPQRVSFPWVWLAWVGHGPPGGMLRRARGQQHPQGH